MDKKILIVDDNPDVILSIKYGLQDINPNYQIIGVKSGEECLEYLANQRVDVVLLDIMMPGISGWETFDRLKNCTTTKDTPVVIITARTDRMSKLAGQFLGAEFIEKPFDMNELNRVIERIFTKPIDKNK